MGRRGIKKGTIYKLYTIYNNKTDMPVIIDGTAEQCAKAMGMKLCSFYPAVTLAKTGKIKKWYIEVRGGKVKKKGI